MLLHRPSGPTRGETPARRAQPGWTEVPPAALELCEGAPPTSLREAIRIVPLACKNAQLNSRARYCFEGG